MSALCLGGWLQSKSPAAARVLAEAGFDWVCVDLEHGDATLADLPALFSAIGDGGAEPWVRIRCPAPAVDDTLPRRVVDLGAAAVIVADVRDSTQIWHVAEAVNYPPRGARGFGYARSNGYGAHFRESLDDAPKVIAQIEHRRGAQNIHGILAQARVAGALIGPLDLSGSAGCLGELDNPKVRGLIETVLGECRVQGKACGLHVVEPGLEAVLAARRAGYDLLALGTDAVFLRDGARRALRLARDMSACAYDSPCAACREPSNFDCKNCATLFPPTRDSEES